MSSPNLGEKNITTTQDEPGSSSLHSTDQEPIRKPSRLSLRGRRPIIWVAVGVAILLVIAGVAVGGVLGARARAYPDYYRINYALRDTYTGKTFFDDFDYFTGYDPTHGFVHYVDREGSQSSNLTETTSSFPPYSLSSEGTAIIRVDSDERNASTGRRSVRITSRKTWDTGLFIFDVVHSPFGCGTWPALWMTDPYNWPDHGEIDIMEAVNMADTGNHMTLHTTQGCKIGKHRRRKQTGVAETLDCWNATNYNAGCGVSAPVDTYGEAFNRKGGGVYAVELRPEGIRAWVFDHSAVPQDIRSSSPDPSTWGVALADFPNLECDVGNHFRNMSIIANIDLCGDWAGQQHIFGSNPLCTGMCSDYVTWRPADFQEAYWEFGGFWVYQKQ